MLSRINTNGAKFSISSKRVSKVLSAAHPELSSFCIFDWFSRSGMLVNPPHRLAVTVTANSFVLFDVSIEITRGEFSLGYIGYTTKHVSLGYLGGISVLSLGLFVYV